MKPEAASNMGTVIRVRLHWFHTAIFESAAKKILLKRSTPDYKPMGLIFSFRSKKDITILTTSLENAQSRNAVNGMIPGQSLFSSLPSTHTACFSYISLACSLFLCSSPPPPRILDQRKAGHNLAMYGSAGL